MNSKRRPSFFIMCLTMILLQSSCSRSLFLNYYQSHFNQSNIQSHVAGNYGLLPTVSFEQNHYSDSVFNDFLIIKCSDTSNCGIDSLPKGFPCFALELNSRSLCKITLFQPLILKPRQTIRAKKIGSVHPICVNNIYYTYPNLRDADGPSYLYRYPLKNYFIQVVEDTLAN